MKYCGLNLFTVLDSHLVPIHGYAVLYNLPITPPADASLWKENVLHRDASVDSSSDFIHNVPLQFLQYKNVHKAFQN